MARRSMTKRRKTTLTIVGVAGVGALAAWFMFPALRKRLINSVIRTGKATIKPGTTAKKWVAEDRAEQDSAYEFAQPLIEAGVPAEDLALRMKLRGFSDWAINYAKSFY